MADQIVVEAGVKIPMRDGTLLDAMIWRPAAPGEYPVLVERVAYELAWRCPRQRRVLRPSRLRRRRAERARHLRL